MDWFKQNPFFGGLALVTTLLLAASGYFAYLAHTDFTLQTEEYAAKMSAVAQARGAKPFPNQANLEAAQAEKAEAQKILGDMKALVAQKSGKIDPTLNPQAFQDRLNAKVSVLEKAAQTVQAKLPDNFYLGFDEYRNQLPAPAAAPLLGQQLDSISMVVSIFLESGVKEITAIKRQPLPVESGKQEKSDANKKDAEDLILAPFDVSFVADQTNFRLAMTKIITADPMIFVRLVSVANSQPGAPLKDTGGAPPQNSGDQAQTEASIPVLLGKETLSVDLRLASISTDAASDKK